jgi:hypothetical protein
MDLNHDKVIQSLFGYDAFAIGTMFVAGADSPGFPTYHISKWLILSMFHGNVTKL